MSNEGLEQEDGVDIERAAAVLESSDEGIEWMDSAQAFQDKWGKEKRFQEILGEARGEQNEAFEKGGMWALAAMGGAFAAIYGLPDNLMQYFDSVDQFQFAEWAAKFDEGLIGVLSAIKSMEAFKEGLNMKPGINRIINSWKESEA